MKQERFKLLSAVHLFLIREDQILLLRRYNTGYEDGNYSVIAGHLDGGETVQTAMVREAREEAGIEIEPSDLAVVGVMHRRVGSRERIDFFLTASRWTGEVENKEPDKCDGLGWFALDDLPDNTIPYIKAALDNYRSQVWFSSFGWEEREINMDTDINQSHSTRRFSNRVELYIKYRPHYPPRMIDFLKNELGLTKAAVVADIGSGTGILTKLFLDEGNPVFGVEPNEEMRAAAEDLLVDYPNFTSVIGSAEATTLPDDVADFVVAGQAFHWFEPVRARAELARILKPGGYVLLIWNTRRESSPFIQAFNELSERHIAEFRTVYQENVRAEALPVFFSPGGYQLKTFDNYQLFNFEEMKGRALSSSYAPLPGHPNHDAFVVGLSRLFTQYQKDGQVEFPYDTQIFYGQVDS